MEETGFHVDRDALKDLQKVLGEHERRLYRKLMLEIPPKVKRRHLNDPKLKSRTPSERLSFGRDDFLADILFGDDGFQFNPVMWTPSTARLPLDQRKPATSKDHLSYFDDHPFVRMLLQYKQLQKMRTTYVGNPAEESFENIKPISNGKKWPKRIIDCYAAADLEPPDIAYIEQPTRRIRLRARPITPSEVTRVFAYSKSRDLLELEDGKLVLRDTSAPKGFWQYLMDGRNDLHPSYWLHRTVTGRSASSDPNGQNLPARGDLAKVFRKVFLPLPGWKLLSADMSQIELRLAAWSSGDPTMLQVYLSGGDIHAATAAANVGVTLGEFLAFKGSNPPYNDRFGYFGIDVHTMNDFYELMR